MRLSNVLEQYIINSLELQFVLHAYYHLLGEALPTSFTSHCTLHE